MYDVSQSSATFHHATHEETCYVTLTVDSAWDERTQNRPLWHIDMIAEGFLARPQCKMRVDHVMDTMYRLTRTGCEVHVDELAHCKWCLEEMVAAAGHSSAKGPPRPHLLTEYDCSLVPLVCRVHGKEFSLESIATRGIAEVKKKCAARRGRAIFMRAFAR
eukprot:TRINITY_DN25673_c0_g1_i1.p1 TRINITY_DN25673_c0_g1~~TRINITY_DN25673_c0_g1_i1.p1  ORF type:complete len:185 (+),score=30.16 TRINITY_DN25673_c0_g1_i1:75-557(+)